AIEASRTKGCGPLRVTARTDEGGHYHLEGLGEAIYTVECDTTPGYLPIDGFDEKRRRMSVTAMAFKPQAARRVNMKLGEKVAGIDFPVTVGASVTGRVFDVEGRPVEDARVMAGRPEDRIIYGDTSAADGTFRIRGFATGPDFYVRAQTEGFALAMLGPFNLTDQGLHDVEFVLEPREEVAAARLVPDEDDLAAVRGIVGVGGQPTINQVVRIYPPDRIPYGGQMARTDVHGVYGFERLSPGEYKGDG
ncbi:unnamed protein product, partial [marine sediment metagenome]